MNPDPIEQLPEERPAICPKCGKYLGFKIPHYVAVHCCGDCRESIELHTETVEAFKRNGFTTIEL